MIELAQTTVSQRPTINQVARDLAGAVSQLLHLAGSGVLLIRDGRLFVAAEGVEMIASLQRLEERLQQGPCVEAARTGQIVALGDLDRYPAKWPDYVTLAESLGIPAVAAIPMGTDREPIGSLGLYDRYGRVWSEEEMASAKVLADLAANYILVASGLEELRATTEQLQQALNSRIVIEQANGIISADRGISIQEAFKVLRKYANDHRASLRTTADAVVHLGLRPR